MGERNILVVVLGGTAVDARLRQAILARGDRAPHVHVVAPARVGALDWLATDEDEARAEAAVRVLETEWTLAGDAETAGEAGESDPVLAVEDALHRFAADEIVLVGGAEEDDALQRALRQFGLPVTTIADPAARPESRFLRGLRNLASGRGAAAPFVIFVVANLALIALAALVTLVVWLLLLFL